jgi:hypothetical protein
VTAGASLLGLAASVVVLGDAVLRRRRALGATALTTGAIALAVHVHLAIHVEALSHWGSLLALGLVAVFAAALFERHGEQLIDKARRLRRRMDAFDAESRP